MSGRPSLLIAGDIGGTKTLLAIYDPAVGARTPLVEREYRSANYPALEVMVKEFLAATNLSVQAACFDVAGPVIDGGARLTNLPWMVEETSLRASLRLDKIFLINDLMATAYAVPQLLPEDLHTINAGRPEANGQTAVVAPGTGLGEAYLVWGGSSYIACPSEGGHAGFAPTDKQQAALWAYLHEKFGHVSYERVCSGQGIANIYDFLCDANPGADLPEFAAQLAQVADRTPLIARAGSEDPVGNSLAAAALEIFVSILADEAANMALKVLATGGVYLAGGIPPRLLAKLTDGRFMQAFVNKGRFAALLSELPVHVVTGRAALLGAAQYGLDRLSAI
jgi:glucokinase